MPASLPSPSPTVEPSALTSRKSGPTRVALVGAGYIADFHLEILRSTPGVETVAVCDADPERARAAAHRFGVAHAVFGLDELAATEAEVAHLTVPPALHARLARQLLELGMSVLVEKPLCLSFDEACALADLARERGLRLAVNHNAVFHPAFVRLAGQVAAGKIGRVEHVRATLCVPLRQLDAGDFSHWMFRAPRNIVFEQATHPLSQIEALIGAPQQIERTLLTTRELAPGQRFHERWIIAAKAEGGTAELHLAFGRPFTRSTLEVIGSDGALEADLFHDQLAGESKTQWLDAWNSYLAGARRGAALRRDARRVFRDWSLFTLGLRRRRDAFFVGMQDSIQAFHEAHRHGGPFPGDPGAASRVLRWCEGVARDVGEETPPVKFPEPGPARTGEVVVLGASGFIGRRVVERLRERGVPTTVLVRRRHALPSAITAGALSGELRLFVTGLDDPERLSEAFRGAHTCLHLATGGGATWEEVEQAMVQASLRVANAAHREGLKRLVYVSSVAALDTGGSAPNVIDDRIGTDPKPETRAIYARGKIETEAALQEFHRRHPIGLLIARPGVVLGQGTPLQHSGFGLWVRDNHCVAWGRGQHPLPVILVDDVAEALVRAALHEGEQLDGRAMNLASRAPLTAAALVQEMAKTTGRRFVFHPRALWLSQAMEIGKWIVKRIGGRKDAPYPSFHDIDARALAPAFACETAREVLGWQPVEQSEELLAALRQAWRADTVPGVKDATEQEGR